MKKQINPTVKAHLIRGAFYLLLLMAVCAIPFALAQRNKLSSTKAQATKAPPTKAQIAAASGKVFQSGAPASLAGQRSQRQARVYNGPVFPLSSVRTQGTAMQVTVPMPSLPRTSQVPLNTSGPLAAHVIAGATDAESAAGGVCMISMIMQGPTPRCPRRSTTSRPLAPIWPTTLSCPEVRLGMCSRSTPTGVYFNGPGPAFNWNVFIYTDNATLPGTQVYSATQPASYGGWHDIYRKPTPAAVLAAGTYWIEIQANMDFRYAGRVGLDRSHCAI